MIYNISSSFLQNYVNFHGKTKLTVEEMFKRLSLEMGGDGSSITKKQLDSYIDKADSGSISVSKQKLSALKQIQKNWDTISKGEDAITAENMKDFVMLLVATMTDSFEVVDNTEANNPNDIYEYLLESMGITDLDEATNADLSNQLNTLLSSDSSDDAIGDAIDSIINIMAARESAPNMSIEA